MHNRSKKKIDGIIALGNLSVRVMKVQLNAGTEYKNIVP